jgi:hypothetical protein
MSGSVLASPLAGSATTTTSASAAASALVWPTTASVCACSRISRALACARSASREPITMG